METDEANRLMKSGYPEKPPRKKVIDGKDIVELVVEQVAGTLPTRASIAEYGAYLYNLQRTLRMYLGDEELVELIDGLHEPDPITRFCIVKALGCLGPGKAVPALVASLKDIDPRVRNAAKLALSAVCRGEPSEEALAALVKAIQDDDLFVKNAAINSLSGLKPRRAFAIVPELIAALRSDSGRTRRAASRCLFGITGKIFLFGRTDPQKWSAWWNDNRDRLI